MRPESTPDAVEDHEHRYPRGAALESFLRDPARFRDHARPVPEVLLHDLWQTQHFDRSALATTDGRPLAVLAPGILNTDAGPDFHAAHLKIDGMDWHGDVEIHRTSGDWSAHRHHEDPRYDSVVLHVTLRTDLHTGCLARADGSTLPELALLPRLRTPLRRLLYRFYTRPDDDTLLCADGWPRVPAGVRTSWVRTLALERLDQKRRRLARRFLALPDLDTLLHELIFTGLGYAKNAEPMADLARRLPLRLARRVGTEDPTDLEALHFGTAGLLPAPGDVDLSDPATAEYVAGLRRRFTRLRKEHALEPMATTQWKFFRLRPPNFPPLRIAQAVALLTPGGLLHRDPIGRLRHALRADAPVQALRDALAARPAGFWDTHFRLEKATAARDPSLGRTRVDILLVNAVLPVLLLDSEQCAEQHDAPELREAVLEVFEQLPASHDRVTRPFETLGTKPRNALGTQGLHQLYRTRCTDARCLSCPIGRHLLGKEEWMSGGHERSD